MPATKEKTAAQNKAERKALTRMYREQEVDGKVKNKSGTNGHGAGDEKAAEWLLATARGEKIHPKALARRCKGKEPDDKPLRMKMRKAGLMKADLTKEAVAEATTQYERTKAGSGKGATTKVTSTAPDGKAGGNGHAKKKGSRPGVSHYPEWHGHSISMVIRALGRAGWSRGDVTNALHGLGDDYDEVSGKTVDTQVHVGNRRRHEKAPTLTKNQLAELVQAKEKNEKRRIKEKKK